MLEFHEEEREDGTEQLQPIIQPQEKFDSDLKQERFERSVYVIEALGEAKPETQAAEVSDPQEQQH